MWIKTSAVRGTHRGTELLTLPASKRMLKQEERTGCQPTGCLQAPWPDLRHYQDIMWQGTTPPHWHQKDFQKNMFPPSPVFDKYCRKLISRRRRRQSRTECTDFLLTSVVFALFFFSWCLLPKFKTQEIWKLILGEGKFQILSGVSWTCWVNSIVKRRKLKGFSMSSAQIHRNYFFNEPLSRYWEHMSEYGRYGGSALGPQKLIGRILTTLVACGSADDIRVGVSVRTVWLDCD